MTDSVPTEPEVGGRDVVVVVAVALVWAAFVTLLSHVVPGLLHATSAWAILLFLAGAMCFCELFGRAAVVLVDRALTRARASRNAFRVAAEPARFVGYFATFSFLLAVVGSVSGTPFATPAVLALLALLTSLLIRRFVPASR